MTIEEAIEKYTEKFGGFPYFLFMGAPEDKVIDSVKQALETGKEIEAEFPDADY